MTGGTVSVPVQSEVNLTGPEPQLVLSDLAKPLSAARPSRYLTSRTRPSDAGRPVEAQSDYFVVLLAEHKP